MVYQDISIEDRQLQSLQVDEISPKIFELFVYSLWAKIKRTTVPIALGFLILLS